MSYNNSNKRNWLVQINDLTNQQIEAVMTFVGTSSGATNPNLNNHNATVAMYLGYKKIPKGTEEPHVTQNLKVILFFSRVFFP